MLEILGIIFLSNINAKNAAARGRKPGGFRGMTIGLWFGGELLGFFIGMAATNGEIYPAYGVALLLAATGGVASYFIAKNCKPGDYRPQQYGPPVNAQALAAPCTLTVTREKSFVGMAVAYHVFLNGQQVGTLKNGESLQLPATLVQNTLLVQDAYGTELKPLYFALPPGGNAQILFNTMKILPERSMGIMPLGEMATVPAAPPQAAPGAPLQPQAMPAATAAQQPMPTRAAPMGAIAQWDEKPMLAVWVLCGALLVMLLGAFTFFTAMGRSYYNTMELTALCFPLALGTCVYLMQQRDAKYNVFAVGGIICGMLFYAFSMTYLNLYVTRLQAPPIGALFNQQIFFLNVRSSVISGSIVAVAAIVIALAYKGPSPKKVFAAALTGAGAMLLYRLFNLRYLFMAPDMHPVRKAGYVITNIFDAACIVLFALIIWMLCTLEKDAVNTGTGAKIWFGICAGATLIVAIVGLATGTVGILGALVALAGVGGYALLFFSKRVGLPIVLGVVLLNVAAGVGAGFTGYQPSVLSGLLPLLGLINPLVTWLLIRGAWGTAQWAGSMRVQTAYPAQAGPAVQMSPAAAMNPAFAVQPTVITRPASGPPAKPLFIAGSIVNILVGGVLFISAVYSMLDSGHLIPGALVGGILAGGAVLALGIFALLQCLGKRKMRMWLLIIQLVLAGVMLLTAIFGIISSIR